MEEKKVTAFLNQYELGKILGNGTFSKVHHGRNTKTGMSVAIKIIDKDVLKPDMIDQIKREISVMGPIRHPNLVHLYEVISTNKKIYFIMEYAQGGRFFDNKAAGGLEEVTARKYFQQLISAVDYCHCRGVYHRNIKPENLLLDEYGNLKVSDFGLGALAASKYEDNMLRRSCQTLACLASDEIEKISYRYDGEKSDVWSCGVFLFLLLVGYFPSRDSNARKMYMKIHKAKLKLPRRFTSDVLRLLSKLLDLSMDKRITTTGIIKDPWFKIGFDSGISDTPMTYVLEPAITPAAISDDVFKPLETSYVAVVCTHKSAIVQLRYSLHAFDIISFLEDFNLYDLLGEKSQEEDAKYNLKEIASTITLKLKHIAKKLQFKEGQKGTFDSGIFEVTPTLHMVELKKSTSNNDTVGYQNSSHKKVEQL